MVWYVRYDYKKPDQKNMINKMVFRIIHFLVHHYSFCCDTLLLENIVRDVLRITIEYNTLITGKLYILYLQY